MLGMGRGAYLGAGLETAILPINPKAVEKVKRLK